jgi:hypothetical protein
VPVRPATLRPGTAGLQVGLDPVLPPDIDVLFSHTRPVIIDSQSYSHSWLHPGSEEIALQSVTPVGSVKEPRSGRVQALAAARFT